MLQVSRMLPPVKRRGVNYHKFNISSTSVVGHHIDNEGSSTLEECEQREAIEELKE